MFSLFRSASDQRFIDHGLVSCPVRGGDVEIDVCAGCRWLLEVDENARLPFVRCRPEEFWRRVRDSNPRALAG